MTEISTAIYPGSFNPWHRGHADVLKKALKVFQRVIIAQGVNPEKGIVPKTEPFETTAFEGIDPTDLPRVSTFKFRGLLVDFIKQLEEETSQSIHAVVRGVRSGYDLEYELQQFYLNEDLGLKIPVVLIPCDRNLGHISSSALRGLKMFGREL